MTTTTSRIAVPPQRFARTRRFDAFPAPAELAGRRAGQPVAAVRLSADLFAEVAIGLRNAGFTVLDIDAHEVGPRPQVVVIQVPEDEVAARRLLGASANGAGRVLVKQHAAGPSAEDLVPGQDEVVQAPFHPLQVAAAALRVGGSSELLFSTWARRVFDDLPARRF
ncbi:MAG: hypothetical protein ACXV2I_12460 [Actinomycetes bacterium]